jgi:hypothetical protein
VRRRLLQLTAASCVCQQASLPPRMLSPLAPLSPLAVPDGQAVVQSQLQLSGLSSLQSISTEALTAGVVASLGSSVSSSAVQVVIASFSVASTLQLSGVSLASWQANAAANAAAFAAGLSADLGITADSITVGTPEAVQRRLRQLSQATAGLRVPFTLLLPPDAAAADAAVTRIGSAAANSSSLTTALAGAGLATTIVVSTTPPVLSAEVVVRISVISGTSAASAAAAAAFSAAVTGGMLTTALASQGITSVVSVTQQPITLQAPPAPSSPPPPSATSDVDLLGLGLSLGLPATVGVGLGGGAVVVALLLACCCCVRRRRATRKIPELLPADKATLELRISARLESLASTPRSGSKASGDAVRSGRSKAARSRSRRGEERLGRPVLSTLPEHAQSAASSWPVSVDVDGRSLSPALQPSSASLPPVVEKTASGRSRRPGGGSSRRSHRAPPEAPLPELRIGLQPEARSRSPTKAPSLQPAHRSLVAAPEAQAAAQPPVRRSRGHPSASRRIPALQAVPPDAVGDDGAPPPAAPEMEVVVHGSSEPRGVMADAGMQTDAAPESVSAFTPPEWWRSLAATVDELLQQAPPPPASAPDETIHGAGVEP